MNTKVATIAIAMLASLSSATPAISGEAKTLPLRTALPSAELRLPPIPALGTMPWLGGWQDVCVPARAWPRDDLAVQGPLAGAPGRKDGAS